MDAAPANDAAKPDPGLPPVQPPSGRFIAQLFVIPGLIILVVVLLFIGSTMLVKRDREPDQFLAQLDSDNADIRWRGASDLAQILKRPEPGTLRWKADAKFALDLAERLDLAFQRLLDREKAIAVGPEKDNPLAWRALNRDRDHLSFLASALGEFHAPVGAPILCAIVKHDKSADLNGNTLQRRKALWSLINMGENLKGFQKMPGERQEALLAGLRQESLGTGPRAIWARTGLYYLDKTAIPVESLHDVVKVDETLATLASAEDRFLRELTAMSFTFWDGELAEPTLLRLAKDNGHGTALRVEEND